MNQARTPDSRTLIQSMKQPDVYESNVTLNTIRNVRDQGIVSPFVFPTLYDHLFDSNSH